MNLNSCLLICSIEKFEFFFSLLSTNVNNVMYQRQVEKPHRFVNLFPEENFAERA